jgi:competence protein ComEA
VPQPTKPQLAIYAAFAIAVLLIGARFLRGTDGGGGGAGSGLAVSGSAGFGGSDKAAEGSSSADGSLGAGTGASSSGAGSLSSAAGALDAGGDGLGEGAGEEAAVAGAGGEIVVDVKGAVRRAGVYRLPPGARALDAVRKAGGMTRRADRLGVNLAAPVTDGGEVVVPRRGASGTSAALGASSAGAGATAGASSGAAGPDGASGAPGTPLSIDINTASEQELEQLDGVGPATAAKILEYRQLHGGFRSIDELDEVSGIGEAKLAAIRAQLGR